MINTKPTKNSIRLPLTIICGNLVGINKFLSVTVDELFYYRALQGKFLEKKIVEADKHLLWQPAHGRHLGITTLVGNNEKQKQALYRVLDFLGSTSFLVI